MKARIPTSETPTKTLSFFEKIGLDGSKWLVKRSWGWPEALKVKYRGHPRVRVPIRVRALPRGLFMYFKYHLIWDLDLGMKASSWSREQVLEWWRRWLNFQEK